VATAVATIAATAIAKVTGTPTVAPTPAPVAINISAIEQTADKFVFEPATLNVRAGQQVTVHYSNPTTNKFPHTFVVKTADGNGEIVKSEQVRPGNTLDINFMIPDAGTFQLLCIQRGHADKGQTGTVTVIKG
jgi:uncharacterized cupredoxin-like copper-binding protein